MEQLEALIGAYSVWILLPLMIVEGPVVTLVASFIASLGLLNVVLVYFISVAGNLIGDLVYYSIGRFGREAFIEKYGKYIGVNREAILFAEKHYNDHLFKTIAIAKATEAPVVPALVLAGMARVDIKKFLIVSLVCEVPKMLVIVLIGYYFGKFYQTIEHYFKDIIFAAGVTLLLLVALLIVYKKIKVKTI